LKSLRKVGIGGVLSKTQHDQAEMKFIELMSELFQLDEAERLDFGFYRVIRHHNQEVKAFLGEIVRDGDTKSLKGGKLSELLQSAFAKADVEGTAGDQLRVKELESSFGIKPGTSESDRKSTLDGLEAIPAMRGQVTEYRSLLDQLRAGDTVASDHREVLNRLYQFFSRHYQDGDFIVERRYGREGSRYIRSTGEDTEFHWATEDMYYIKSGDTFTDFPVRLSNGNRIVFSVEPGGLNATRASLNPTDKAHYELDRVEKDVEGHVIVLLKYLKGAQSNAQKTVIAEALQEYVNADEAELRRWLNHFIARNQSDFFIHKRLGEALRDDLDIFLKTEVLNADQLLVDNDLPRRLIKVGRIVRQIGRQIIDFLAVMEDFQKALWEKKKLVFETRYVITLDRIAKLAGEDWLEEHLPKIVSGQKDEWNELGLGNFDTAENCKETIDGDLAAEVRERWLPLPLDTKNFDIAFKWELIDAVTASESLDHALDGIAIRSDNYQALNTLEYKHQNCAKCVYIDPPYNTNASGIPYKNGYRHASWAQLMHNRISLLRSMMLNDGAIFVSIDKVERDTLAHVLEDVFGKKNQIEELIWTQNTNDGRSPTYSTNHEYVLTAAKHRPSAESDPFMFREPKPGFREVMELVLSVQDEFPKLAKVEADVRALYAAHRKKYKEQVLAEGQVWEDAKRNDPWKGTYSYNRAEYRDNSGQLVDEAEARQLGANIWVFTSSDWTIMSSETKQSPTVFDASDPNYRFYSVPHPKTGIDCKPSERGWKGTRLIDSKYPDRNSMESLLADDRLLFGDDETTVPRQKRMLHEVETNVAKSVFVDFSDGEKETKDLFGKAGVFLAPKHSDFVMRFIQQTTNSASTVVDCFGGSGSSAHAVMRANAIDKGHRKFITVEVNKYFNSLIVPRIKKVAGSQDWSKGTAQALNGYGAFIRIQELEQYEDTLENLVIEDAQGYADSLFDDPVFAIKYKLDRKARRLYQSIENFRTPFGHTVKSAHDGGEAVSREVDLVESLIYLLGLDVARLYREDQGVVITGKDQRNRSVTVLFRECDREGNSEWTAAKMQEHEANRYLTNAMPELKFEGCDRFEAIEAAFAMQFGSR